MYITIPFRNGQFQRQFTFESLGNLKDQPGVYVVLRKDAPGDQDWTIIDVGQSESIKSRLENHDRKQCWEKENYTDLAVLYSEDNNFRVNTESGIRTEYAPPCGER